MGDNNTEIPEVFVKVTFALEQLTGKQVEKLPALLYTAVDVKQAGIAGNKPGHFCTIQKCNKADKLLQRKLLQADRKPVTVHLRDGRVCKLPSQFRVKQEPVGDKHRQGVSAI